MNFNDTGLKNSGQVSIVLGGQWGDEGKGKLVDFLSPNFDYVCRCQGGCNAGHTVIVQDKTFKFHLLPSGIGHNSITCIIGNGCVITLPVLFKEIDECIDNGFENVESRLLISDRAHVVTSLHISMDCANEDSLKTSIGTTRKGIGPCYATKAFRSGIRICDIIYNDRSTLKSKLLSMAENLHVTTNLEDIDRELDTFELYKTRLSKMVCSNIPYILSSSQNDGTSVLIEGANGAMLDIDFGTYPFVTSSNCTVGGACTGLGVSPLMLNDVVGVMKAYTTRVGDGPFPTELKNEIGDLIRKSGQEYGATTGRPRRCGWLDLVAMKYSATINGFTRLALMKMDVLAGFEHIFVAVKYRNKLTGKESDQFPSTLVELELNVEPVYEKLQGWGCIDNLSSFSELPSTAQKFVQFISSYLKVPIEWIGYGPARNQMCFVQSSVNNKS
ncbi:hypothetical protein GJ496_003073 [Pomphorhynchus laevis]|nr:hypothetical protein GJ496_003073 [Pomphorhynchus laevis]